MVCWPHTPYWICCWDVLQLKKALNKMTELDCLCIKKYYYYYIKTLWKKNVEDIMDHSMAPLDHLFDNHKHCDSCWCHAKRIEENPKQCNEVWYEQKKGVTVDEGQTMLSYMLNYVNCTSHMPQKNALHSVRMSLTHRSIKVWACV